MIRVKMKKDGILLLCLSLSGLGVVKSMGCNFNIRKLPVMGWIVMGLFG